MRVPLVTCYACKLGDYKWKLNEGVQPRYAKAVAFYSTLNRSAKWWRSAVDNVACALRAASDAPAHVGGAPAPAKGNWSRQARASRERHTSWNANAEDPRCGDKNLCLTGPLVTRTLLVFNEPRTRDAAITIRWPRRHVRATRSPAHPPPALASRKVNSPTRTPL